MDKTTKPTGSSSRQSYKIDEITKNGEFVIKVDKVIKLAK